MHTLCWRDRAITWATRVFFLLSASYAWAGVPFGSTVVADLDGDRTVDIATAGAMRRDAAGYLLDISVRFGSSEAGAITVRTRRAAGRITARDIDGDSDRDLILESFDREPLAVVLNDGGGHFHQGNLEDFGALARRPARQSVDAPVFDHDSPEAGESAASPADAPALLASPPAAVRAQRVRPCSDAFRAPETSARASRAPPALL